MKKYKPLSKNRRMFKLIVDSPVMRVFVLFLTVVYTLSVFASLSFDDFLDAQTSFDITHKFLYLELVILIFFIIEIFMQIVSQSIKGYLNDKWLLLDALVIFASFGLVIYELENISSTRVNTVTKVVRAIFRFLRIFILIRKSQQFQVVKISQTIRTNSEKITEILQEVMECITDENVVADLDWCKELILQNRLNDASEEENNKEAAQWIAGYKNTASQRRLGLRGVAQPQVRQNAAGQRNQQSRKSILPIQHQLQNLHIPLQVSAVLSDIESLKFNCFELQRYVPNSELTTVVHFLFEENDLYASLNIDEVTMKAFIKNVEKGYLDNPYHNRLHATDVTQTVNFFLTTVKLESLANISNQQRACLYVAAAIHDYNHPGVNNLFLINTDHHYALTYNDKAVLESYHVASCYQMLMQDQYNIFSNFEPKEQLKVRASIISMVLSTDMALHFADVAKLKAALSSSEFDMQDKDQQIIMDAIVHASDISNPLKPFDICKEWTKRVLEEFWNQGDQERELGVQISYLCDRYSTNLAKSQIGFIDFIVKPFYDVLCIAMPELKNFVTNFENNKQHWQALQDFYDNKLRELNEERDRTKANETKNLLSCS